MLRSLSGQVFAPDIRFVRVLMYPGTEVGMCLNIRHSAVSHAVRRGGVIVAESPEIVDGLFIAD